MIEIQRPDALLRKLLPPQRPQTGMVYVPSRFVLSFEHRGRSFLYNTLTKQVIVGTLPERAAAGEGSDDLIGGLFLVPEGRDETAFYLQISALMRAYSDRSGHRTYTILPTLACNARCVYCYEEGMEQVTMTPEIADRTVRYILDTRRGRQVKLYWFGGEPTLRPDLIDRICAGVRAAGVDYVSGMTTNASLITPELAEHMRSVWHLRTVQVSMDGAEADYLGRKRYRADRDWYRIAMESVDLLAEQGVSVVIRCNVDEGNWPRVPEFLRDLKDTIRRKDRVSLYFCPLNEVRTSPRSIDLWRKIVAIRPEIRDAGFGINTGSRIMSFRVHHCLADCGSVVITPDGSLYPCDHCTAAVRIGSVFDGITDAAGHREFCRTDAVREKCAACPFLPECTAFAACPIQDPNCRALRELIDLDRLRVLIDRQDGPDAADEDEEPEDSFC